MSLGAAARNATGSSTARIPAMPGKRDDSSKDRLVGFPVAAKPRALRPRCDWVPKGLGAQTAVSASRRAFTNEPLRASTVEELVMTGAHKTFYKAPFAVVAAEHSPPAMPNRY